MNTRLFDAWDALRSSYWFIPALMSFGAVGLAFATLTVDRTQPVQVEQGPRGAPQAGAARARCDNRLAPEASMRTPHLFTVLGITLALALACSGDAPTLATEAAPAAPAPPAPEQPAEIASSASKAAAPAAGSSAAARCCYFDVPHAYAAVNPDGSCHSDLYKVISGEMCQRICCEMTEEGKATYVTMVRGGCLNFPGGGGTAVVSDSRCTAAARPAAKTTAAPSTGGSMTRPGTPTRPSSASPTRARPTGTTGGTTGNAMSRPKR